jgi:hypothetical protein
MSSSDENICPSTGLNSTGAGNGVGVLVGLLVGLGTAAVGVGVKLGVCDGVRLGAVVGVSVGVRLGVLVGVCVAVCEAVGMGVRLGSVVGEAVGVGVCEGVSVAPTVATVPEANVADGVAVATMLVSDRSFGRRTRNHIPVNTPTTTMAPRAKPQAVGAWPRAFATRARIGLSESLLVE